MSRDLPMPPHYHGDRVAEVYRVDYEACFHAASAWADEHSVEPASTDRRRVCLLAVDVQNTFCAPGFELFVAGRSGTGAVDDSKRLCEFVYRNLAAITEVVVTMDTHQAFQIFHAPFLVDPEGRHPDPYTLVTVADVASGLWSVDPRAAETLGVEANEARGHLRSYVEALAAGGKYDLTIWPFHAMLGGIGHALVSALEEAFFFHSIARRAQTRFEIKGRHPLTEHYSVLGPEVRQAPDDRLPGARNDALVGHLCEFDAVIVAGQAKSHCVAWTVADLLLDAPEIAPRLYLLQDCSSPVVVPGAVDYTDAADGAFAAFAEQGVHVGDSTIALDTWLAALAVR